jgi:hypothetical protein
MGYIWWDDDDVDFAVDQLAYLDIMLALWYNSPRVSMTL